MQKKTKNIPVNTLPSGIGEGIFVGSASYNGLPNFKEVERSHRDGGHSFVLQERGVTHLEIDFEKHRVEAPAIIYMHPNQVHRVITFEDATVSSLIITSENLQPEYLKILEGLTPVNPLPLNAEAVPILSEIAAACIRHAERKHEKLYHSILREGCNTFVALIASQFLARSKPANNYSRFEVIAKEFKAGLERAYTTLKSPTAYAKQLNITTPYLNECVKAATGHSVSYHIQQRIVLEAKRLLHHSDKSVKEIAAHLGYDDHSYFIRLFARVSGMTPLAFRAGNLE